MLLKYVAYNERRERVTGIVEASSPEEAELILWRSNLTVAQMKRVRRLPSVYELFPTLFRVRRTDLIFFAQQLVALLESGTPLFPSLKQMAQRVPNRRLRAALRRVAQDVEAGARFSGALARHPAIFPQIFIRLSAIGEEVGQLTQMLHRVVSHLVKQEELLSRVKRAMTYPAFIAVVGLVGVVVLLVFALPPLSGLFEYYGASLPLPARILVGLNRVIRSYGLWLLLFIVVVSAGGVWYFKTPSGARRWDRLLLRLPTVGRTVVETNLANITYTLFVLLSSGIPLTEALNLTEGLIQSPSFRQSLREVRLQIASGQSFAEALSQHPLFPALLVEAIRTAEQTGTLPQSLEIQSRFYEQQTERAMSGLTSLIQPVTIIIMAGVVGFIAAAVFSSIYSLLGQIK